MTLLFLSLLRLDPQNNQITPDDRLTVLCEITIDGKDVQQSGQASGSGVSVADYLPHVPDITPSPLFQVSQAKSTSKICSEKLSSDFNFLLETGSFSDVTMKCEGVELSCHKLILGARYELWK